MYIGADFRKIMFILLSGADFVNIFRVDAFSTIFFTTPLLYVYTQVCSYSNLCIAKYPHIRVSVYSYIYISVYIYTWKYAHILLFEHLYSCDYSSMYISLNI